MEETDLHKMQLQIPVVESTMVGAASRPEGRSRTLDKHVAQARNLPAQQSFRNLYGVAALKLLNIRSEKTYFSVFEIHAIFKRLNFSSKQG